MTSTASRTAPAATYMVHLFGRGLVDEGRCYAVERYNCNYLESHICNQQLYIYFSVSYAVVVDIIQCPVFNE